MNPTGYSRSKHIDIQYHFIREQLAQSIIALGHISTNDMAANGLNKALPKNLFKRFKDFMSLELI